MESLKSRTRARRTSGKAVGYQVMIQVIYAVLRWDSSFHIY